MFRVRSAPPPARAAPARAAPAQVPAAAPVSTPAMAPQSQGPSLMGQMAATAGGVAIGSAVGHTIGHAMTGLFSGGSSDAAVAQAAPVQQAQAVPQGAQGQAEGACAFEIKQFLQCAQNQSDLTLCEGFNEAIRQCKMSNNCEFTHFFYNSNH